MAPSLRRLLVASACIAGTVGLAACGEEGIQLSESDPNYEGAKIFQQHCSGCHTLAAAGAEGSATNIHDREYKDGPNFNEREEEKDQVLYAIENGGFSSGPMPQDIVVGEQAEKVAEFVSKYSGRGAPTQQTPTEPTGAQGDG